MLERKNSRDSGNGLSSQKCVPPPIFLQILKGFGLGILLYLILLAVEIWS